MNQIFREHLTQSIERQWSIQGNQSHGGVVARRCPFSFSTLTYSYESLQLELQRGRGDNKQALPVRFFKALPVVAGSRQQPRGGSHCGTVRSFQRVLHNEKV
jgi:hypothetical protein